MNTRFSKIFQIFCIIYVNLVFGLEGITKLPVIDEGIDKKFTLVKDPVYWVNTNVYLKKCKSNTTVAIPLELQGLFFLDYNYFNDKRSAKSGPLFLLNEDGIIRIALDYSHDSVSMNSYPSSGIIQWEKYCINESIHINSNRYVYEVSLHLNASVKGEYTARMNRYMKLTYYRDEQEYNFEIGGGFTDTVRGALPVLYSLPAHNESGGIRKGNASDGNLEIRLHNL